MSLLNYLLEQTAVYSLWQAPFAAEKLAPVLAHNDIRQARRVLDVGCGPGTNTHLFGHADYLGMDINPGYIEHARRKHNRRYVVADVTTYEDAAGGEFDFILINSFLHHIDTPSAHRILERLRSWLSPDGHMHILELVAPGDRSIAQLLANCDRGKYARPLAEWRELFEAHLDIAVFEPYALRALGIGLWNMVYCKGKAKP
ncbi:MAG: class I SAM-dependent methyltransferase [Acidobacteriia bacterium]|nr:class I SAM-dependent methyltransferase [Terriglobia bacterium]